MSAGAVQQIFYSGSAYAHITTAATTVVKANPTVFTGLVVNTGGASSTATVYDSLTASGTIIAVIDTATRGQLTYSVPCRVGLTVVTASGTPADLTVLFV